MSDSTGEQAAVRRTPVLIDVSPAPSPGIASAASPSSSRAARGSSPLRSLLSVLDLISDGRYAEADDTARSLSFGSLVWGLASPITVPAGLLSQHWSEIRRQPALLGLAALVRQQISGDVAAMDADLSRAARLLQREATTDPTRRVANLALASLCLLLSSQLDDAVATAQRSAELLADINESPRTPAPPQEPVPSQDPAPPQDPASLQNLASAACDLAGIFAIVGDAAEAARLWAWVRSVISDPSSPLLVQVDIGLSCAAIFIGDRTGITSSAHRAATADHHAGLWRALVLSARCYDALDDLAPLRALDASRSAVDMLPNPYALASLVSAHVTALIASGRPDWAIDFLAAVDEHGSASSDVSVLGQTRLLLRVAAHAASGDAAASAAYERRMPQGSPLRKIASAYHWLWAGRPDQAADAAADIGDAVLMPRLESMRHVIAAAAHLRAGRDEVALSELFIVGSIAELHGVRSAMLLIPRTGVEALTALAAAHGALGVIRHLPDAASVSLESVPRLDLSARESEILDLVARGLTNPEIAARVFISPNTVKYHLARIYRRMGVSTRDEAVSLAYRLRTAAGAVFGPDSGAPDG